MAKKDNRKTVEVDLDRETFTLLAIEAHKKDITFNELVTSYLENFIDKTKDMSKKEIKLLLEGKNDI